ncbi:MULTISPECIES: hypothetical protein [unclassified Prevotella]|jgi:hypothetical protein|uniref:hypothetical protein n=1 Tax=unclassified Prevotella TaxID=2638335 RepID=UPI0008C85A51|nr:MULTISPECIES: hypothetical protein [unclassified Prevotella]SEV82069.1 hypothetical protein SAMN04487827_0211 [Prevotella sp. khp7]
MNIIQRNFFRLIRSGAFNTTEHIEPMSVYKWERLMQLTIMHQVVPYVYEGLQRCKNQFFLKQTDYQWREWLKLKQDAERMINDDEGDEFLRADHLTNPLLNRQLQNILDDEHSDTISRKLLLLILRIVRHILNEGMPVSQLVELGRFLQNEGDHVDKDVFRKWISKLKLSQMCQLEGEFLVLLFGFKKDDVFFLEDKQNKHIEEIAQELIDFTNTRSQDWYFSQDSDSIFVHNSNTTAMFSHVKRSARYFRYYPSESLTNFFASFVHSLSHIEE